MIAVLFLQGLSLPLKGVCRPFDSNVVAASGSLEPQTSHANNPKISKTDNISLLTYVLNSSYSYFFRVVSYAAHLGCMYALYLAPM